MFSPSAPGVPSDVAVTSVAGRAGAITLTEADIASLTTDLAAKAPLVSPSFTTPTLGVASATSINKLTFTAPASGSTLTIADGKTLTASNTLTLAGTDSSTLNIGTGGTLAASAFSVPTTILGNAGTATALATARAINGVNFDGTAAITITAAAGTLSGSTLASGVTGSSLTSVSTLGTLTVSGAATLNHLVGSSTAPTIAAGAGAGTSPTVAVTGTDVAGKVSITAGVAASASSIIATITFNTAFAGAPYVQLTPANANAALLSGVTMVYLTSTTATFVINAGTTGLSAGAYVWNYSAIG